MSERQHCLHCDGSQLDVGPMRSETISGRENQVTVDYRCRRCGRVSAKTIARTISVSRDGRPTPTLSVRWYLR